MSILGVTRRLPRTLLKALLRPGKAVEIQHAVAHKGRADCLRFASPAEATMRLGGLEAWRLGGLEGKRLREAQRGLERLQKFHGFLVVFHGMER